MINIYLLFEVVDTGFPTEIGKPLTCDEFVKPFASMELARVDLGQYGSVRGEGDDYLSVSNDDGDDVAYVRRFRVAQ